MTLSFLLPPPPADWDKEREFKVLKKLTKCSDKTVEPVGHEFLASARRFRTQRTIEEDEELQAALLGAEGDDLNMDDDEPETPALLRSNPSEWKKQDHYAVLGLSKRRYLASEEDIKRAYRRKVLKHHPDKKAAGGNTMDDSFFKCIQKAWEVISDPSRRRIWDSCDPQFDDRLPNPSQKGDFFSIYGPVFERESRFSKILPVPTVGDADSTREEVEAFYDFWYRFESWRSFEMMDEEDTDGIENREERRYLDKKNKAARTKRKKEDNARVIRLVEQAFKLDPRIQQFKDAEKAAKDAKKREKEAVQKAAEEEARRQVEEAQREKERQETEEKERAAQEKKEREAKKNAIRKQKKDLKRFMRDNGNLLPDSATPQEIEEQLAKLDAIVEGYEADEIEYFRTRLEDAVSQGLDALNEIFGAEFEAAKNLEATRAARAEELAKHIATRQVAPKAETPKPAPAPAARPAWSPKEINALIKAVKNTPSGTQQKWEKIADYVNTHGGANANRSAAECIEKSKEVSSGAADRLALQSQGGKKNDAVITEQPSVKDTPATPTTPASTFVVPEGGDWTTDQQTALEAAMRKFPAMTFRENPKERWEKIAGEISGKSAKDVQKRVKELADLVQKKKKKGGK
ncbi:uncharacterized protein BJ171DRAFT_514822 [Polychytrium aggregatum]|uniref:uncharacterized protein n=1 Tax=Polychytrium aggregatum TaxID=110093 RepID=UPI0022FDFB6D|nr:uncharacterized protein BJ171DRAFT_514822 [Polychytrium aggregatum]KAI9202380.1 hypothetical protein BJ171DRAFT_514822 [Polychytrium aggregatum]